MSLIVSIKKHWKGFCLQTEFGTDKKRTGILGESGCGKSMTLKCIAGIEKPDIGRIVLNDRILFDSEQKINLPPRERKIGFLFQNYALFPNMTVEQNIASGLRCKGRQKQHKVMEQIEYFNLEGLEKRYPAELSGGQQQRTALARMMACEPELIMLDEPFSALDYHYREQLQIQLLQTLDHYRGEVLIVSHNRDEIYRFSQRAVVLANGTSILSGKTKDIFHNPGHVEAAKLTGCKNLSPISWVEGQVIHAKDWNCNLTVSGRINDKTSYVGIRAHSVLPSYQNSDINRFRCIPVKIMEEPFEVSILFRVSDHPESCILWWKMKKESWIQDWKEQVPEYIQFPKEELLLLK